MVTVYRSVTKTPLKESEVKKIVIRVLQDLRVTGSLVVHLVGDKRIQSLNRMHRGKDAPTDVLSFPIRETSDLGDIFLSAPYIVRQARRLTISPREEMARMLVHGVLHILGYDHETKREAARMFSLQERYVATVL